MLVKYNQVRQLRQQFNIKQNIQNPGVSIASIHISMNKLCSNSQDNSILIRHITLNTIQYINLVY